MLFAVGGVDRGGVEAEHEVAEGLAGAFGGPAVGAGADVVDEGLEFLHGVVRLELVVAADEVVGHEVVGVEHVAFPDAMVHDLGELVEAFVFVELSAIFEFLDGDVVMW